MRTTRWLAIIAIGGLVALGSLSAVGSDDPPSGEDLKRVTGPAPATATQLPAGEAESTGTSAAAPTADFVIPWSSINSGGQPSSSANFTVSGSVGQAAIGEAGSVAYDVGIGYWYGAVAVGGDCACDCHADPQCDGVTNVLDVVLGVNVAFRGAAPIIDPNPLCPYQNTDVNCSGFTDVIDVVKLVNVAFRGGDPAVEFCAACP